MVISSFVWKLCIVPYLEWLYRGMCLAYVPIVNLCFGDNGHLFLEREAKKILVHLQK